VRRDAEFLADQEAVLVYIARKLREALALEEVMTAAGVDYVVETGEYLGGFIFQSVRTGAFFYVHPDTEQAARELMVRHGYKPFEDPLKAGQ
jgi:hypothetical protein